MSAPPWAVALAAGAVAAPLLAALLPGLLHRLGLRRTSYTGRAILTGGGLAALPVLVPFLLLPDRNAALAAGTGLGCLALGLADDAFGVRHPERAAAWRGVRGHLRALRHGQLTTGLLKAAGVLAVGAAAGWLHAGPAGLPRACLLTALGANLLNLLDLRPLRALKLFWLLGAAMVPVAPATLAALLGATWAYARREARGEVMLGDAGANCLGAVLGLCAYLVLPVPAAWATAALAAVFHLWAERCSLSAWIERHAWARRLDDWGRQPAAPLPRE